MHRNIPNTGQGSKLSKQFGPAGDFPVSANVSATQLQCYKVRVIFRCMTGSVWKWRSGSADGGKTVSFSLLFADVHVPSSGCSCSRLCKDPSSLDMLDLPSARCALLPGEGILDAHSQ